MSERVLGAAVRHCYWCRMTGHTTYTTAEKIFYSLLFAALLGMAAYQRSQMLFPDTEFEQGLDGYAAGPGSLTPVQGAFALKSDGEYVVQSKGQSQFVSLRKIFVDPDTPFRAQIRVRVLVGERVDTIAGVLQFDAAKRALPEKPQLLFFRKKLSPSDGWVEAEGTVKLSPETAFVRPIAILNYSAPKAVSQIDYLRFDAAP